VASLKAKSWNVSVEVRQVDIRLDAGDGSYVILVENKLQAGSKQQGQLLRYYDELIGAIPGVRVVAVYLAPGGVGESEVDAVEASQKFCQRRRDERSRDFSVHVSWEQLIENLHQYDTDEFIASGMREIRDIIDRPEVVYPNEGGREEVHRIACTIRETFERAFPIIKLGPPWPAKDRFILGSRGTNLTLWLILKFDAEPTAPYKPIGLFDGDRMCLAVRSMLKLSAEGSRKPELKSRWRELLHAGTISVPGVGIHKVQGRWLVYERELHAAPDHIVNELTSMGASMLQVVGEWESGVPHPL
jgi:hypothetical protein